MSELHSLPPYTFFHASPPSINNSSPLAFAIEPPFSPDFSTGYLEDALVEFSSKRPRLLLYAHNSEQVPDGHLDDLQAPQGYWGSCCTWGDASSETFDWTNHVYDMNYDAVSADADEPISSSSPKSRFSEETYTDLSAAEMKTPEVEAFSTPNYYYEDPNSSSSSSKHPVRAEFLADKETIFSMGRKLPISSGDGSDTKKKKKRKVVYPFALVKPGGEEGDVTLNDINQKILMPPTRPVRHPVGDFACRPCVSAEGPGLSGKAVVALTRIHTQGRRGSITIIRTKG